MRINKSRLRRDMKLGVKNLLLHKLRSFLTMLGLVFGVGSVIAMLAIGEGASEEALAQIRKLGARNIIITAKVSDEDNRAVQNNVRMSIYGLLYDDFQRLSATIPTIKAAVPVKMMQKDASLGERTQDLRIVGTTQQWFDLVEREMVAGRKMTAEDVENHASVAVLSEHGARNLLATETAIGSVLRIGANAYEVIGIVKSDMTGNESTPDQMTDAYVPLTTSREHFGDVFYMRKNGANIREMVELHRIILNVESDEMVEPTAEAVEYTLALFHKKKDYTISVPLALLRQAEATKRTFAIVLGSIAGISLLVGGIGIMNIMLATVTERTREIGIRRAIGARAGQIVSQFLIETMVLSLTGGFIGIFVGMFIPWLVTTFARMPTIITPISIILSLGISVTVGIVFGIYPAIRASKLDPIIALRHE